MAISVFDFGHFRSEVLGDFFCGRDGKIGDVEVISDFFVKMHVVGLIMFLHAALCDWRLGFEVSWCVPVVLSCRHIAVLTIIESSR